MPQLTDRDETLLNSADGESLDFDETITGANARIADIKARAKTLDLKEIPQGPIGGPGNIMDESASEVAAMVAWAKQSGKEFHDKWATDGIPVDEGLAPDLSEEETPEAREVQAQAWQRSMVMTRVYDDYLRQMIITLGGDVPDPDGPAYEQLLFGRAETALEALRVLKMNWDSVQPLLAAQAADERPVEVAADGGSEPEEAE